MRIEMADDDEAYVPILVLQKFQKLEEQIKVGEKDAMRVRWECGKYLLEQRVGKKLPAGYLDNLAGQIGVGRWELQKRAKLAEKFSTEKRLCDAVTQWPAWRDMVSKGLPEKRAEAKPKASPKVDPASRRLLFKQLHRLIPKIHAADLTEPELRDFDAIYTEMSRIYDELGAQKRMVAK